MAVGTQRQVRLSDLGHVDGGLHTAIHAFLLEEVLESKAVHDRAEHAHVVTTGAVHPALLQLRAAEEVATADNHSDLSTGLGNLGDLPGHVLHHVGVDAHSPAAEHFTAQLQHDSLESITVFDSAQRKNSFIDYAAGYSSGPSGHRFLWTSYRVADTTNATHAHAGGRWRSVPVKHAQPRRLLKLSSAETLERLK